MKIRPLHDRVLIRRLDSEEKTAGGIIIPDTAQEKPMEARTAQSTLWMSRRATAFCSANGPAPK